MISNKQLAPLMETSILCLFLATVVCCSENANRANELNPEWIVKAQFHFEEVEHRIATKYCDSILDVDSNNFEALVLHAKSSVWYGGKETALHSAERAIDLNPKDSRGFVARGYVLMNVYPPDKAGAMKDFQEAIALNEQDDLAFLYRAQLKFGFGDYLGTRKDYSTAIRLNPDSPEGYYRRALLKISMGENWCSDYRKAAERGYVALYDDIAENCN